MSLRKWIIKWLQAGQDQPAERERDISSAKYSNSINAIGTVTSREHGPARLNFNVMPAAGGVVVSITKFDNKLREHTETLHVLHDDDDIATNIGHIVSMELLRV